MKKALPFFIIILTVAPAAGFAAGLVPCGPGTSQKYCDLCDLFQMVVNVYDFIMRYIVPSLAGLMVAVGGLMYVVGGAGQTTARGTAILKATAIGLLIAYASYLIVNTVFYVLGANFTWNQINCGGGEGGYEGTGGEF